MGKIDYGTSIQKLIGGIGINTTTGNVSGFLDFYNYLKQNYPKLHNIADINKIQEYGLLYKIPGKTNKDPVCFIAHMDTVPQGDGWTYNAAGELKNDYIFGRGAFDMKGQLFAILEATEHFLCEHDIPERDIYLFFGCDEENANNTCAREAAQFLKKQNVNLEYVIDEGGMIIQGGLFGIAQDVAVIGICEKGYLDIELVARDAGGHSSLSCGKTALTKVCLAVSSLEEVFNDKQPGSISKQMLSKLGIKDVSKFDNNGKINSMLYDTYAPVMSCASDAMNVLPVEAKIGINIRIVNGNTIQNTISKIKSALPADIEINILNGNEPTTISNTNSSGYKKIYGAMQKIFSRAKIVPGMVSVGTDCRHFHEICENVFRITPFINYLEDSKTIHKPDEKLSVESFISAIHFYYGLLEK